MKYKTYDGKELRIYDVTINPKVLNNINNRIIENQPMEYINCKHTVKREEDIKYDENIVKFYPKYYIGAKIIKKQQKEKHVYNYPSFCGAYVVKKPCICRSFENFDLIFLGWIKKDVLPNMKNSSKREIYKLAIEHYINEEITMNLVEKYSFNDLKLLLEHSTLEQQKEILKELDKYADNYRNLQYVMKDKKKYFSAKSYKELKSYCLK